MTDRPINDSRLFQLKPDCYFHGENLFWFASDGTLYYGKDRYNLIFPDVLELKGSLSPLSLADLKAAFLLGRQAAYNDLDKAVKDRLEKQKEEK